MIGRTLSHFKITAKLGEGGMGAVYRAEDSNLGRDVAIKVLPEEMAGDPERLERFKREARSVAALNHPNIVTIYTVEEAGGIHLLSMEVVEGKSLDQLLPPSGFALEILFPLAIQIADALAAAHDGGITHRDLKPANVMVTGEGRVKILDFGLAKLAESEMREEATQLMTQDGMILGTVPYMSPEQVQGQPVDPRSDIFSLGILLHEMATGQRPFRGDNEASVISSVLKDHPPRVSDIRAHLPKHFGRIVRRCLEKRPERRYQSATDVKIELEGLQEELRAAGTATGDTVPGVEPVAVLARSARRASLLPWILAGASLAAAVILGVIALRPAPQPSPVISNLLPPAGYSFNAVDGPAVLSPDGREIAFLAAAPDQPTHLFVRSFASPEARRLEGTGDAQAPFWSPDGRSLGFFADGKLKRVDVEEGRPRVLADAPWPGGGSWGRSGKIIFVGHGEMPPSLVDAEGGQARELPAPYAGVSSWYLWPHFLPGDRHYLLAVQDLSGPNSGILVASVDPADGFHRLTRRISNAVYLRSGKLLLWDDGAVLARPFDLDTLELGEGVSRLADGVGWGQYLSFGRFSVSENGVLAYQPGPGATGDTELVRVDRGGRELSVVAPQAEYYFPRLSGDGQKVAVDLTDIQATHGDIWIFDIERGTRTRLTDGAADESIPVWLPDDSEVVFMRSPDLFRRDAAAAREESVLLASAAHKEPADISPDGRLLLFENRVTDHYDFRVLELASGEERPWVESRAVERNGRFSPDGRWVAYQSNESGVTEIHVRSFPEGDERFVVSTDGGAGAVWRSDGSELFYYSPETSEVTAVAVTWAADGPRFGAPQGLFQARMRDEFDVFPDGRSFLLNRLVPPTAEEPLVLVQNWEQRSP